MQSNVKTTIAAAAAVSAEDMRYLQQLQDEASLITGITYSPLSIGQMAEIVMRDSAERWSSVEEQEQYWDCSDRDFDDHIVSEMQANAEWARMHEGGAL